MGTTTGIPRISYERSHWAFQDIDTFTATGILRNCYEHSRWHSKTRSGCCKRFPIPPTTKILRYRLPRVGTPSDSRQASFVRCSCQCTVWRLLNRSNRAHNAGHGLPRLLPPSPCSISTILPSLPHRAHACLVAIWAPSRGCDRLTPHPSLILVGIPCPRFAPAELPIECIVLLALPPSAFWTSPS